MESLVPLLYGIMAFWFGMRILLGNLVKLFPKTHVSVPATLPTLSVVIPCYNESNGIYRTLESLSKADYPPELFDITVVDDCSTDDSVQWIQQAILEFSHININLKIQPKNSGKQAALTAGFHACKGEIFVLFDSDVVVNRDVLKAFVRELQDPKLGVVGASCGVYDINRDLISQGYASVFYTLHEWQKQVESKLGCVGVIDGKAMGFRRSVYGEAVPILDSRRWLGLHVQAGDDRYVTHVLTLRGYTSRVVLERIATSAPPTLVDLYKQQIRWRRSGLRDFLWTLWTMRQHCTTLGPLKTYVLLASRFYYVLFPMMGLLILYLTGITGYLLAHLAFVPVLLGIRLTMNIHARFYNPDQVVSNPVLSTLAISSWMNVDLFIGTVVALFSMDEGGWGTRNLSSVVDKSVIQSSSTLTVVTSDAMVDNVGHSKTLRTSAG